MQIYQTKESQEICWQRFDSLALYKIVLVRRARSRYHNRCRITSTLVLLPYSDIKMPRYRGALSRRDKREAKRSPSQVREAGYGSNSPEFREWMAKLRRFLEDNANFTSDQRKEKLLEHGFTEEDVSVIETKGRALLFAEPGDQPLYSQTHSQLGHVKGTIKTGLQNYLRRIPDCLPDLGPEVPSTFTFVTQSGLSEVSYL